MEDKKEVQEMIIAPTPVQNNGRVTEDEFFNVLKMVAPGTNLRAALDGILKTGKGALLVVENDSLLPLLDGGFRVNCRFTPQRLIELSKMDGAIVLSKDVKKINYANVLLTPDSKIKTLETGTRYKAAERTAKEITGFVIAISERRNEIHLFYKNIKYPIKSTDEILRKANEHIQLIEKQRELFDKYVEKLTHMELRNYPSLQKAVMAIQKGRMISKIADDLKKYIVELGSEGILLKSRLREITAGVEREITLIIKDYTRLDTKRSKMLLEELSYDDILDNQNILRILNCDTTQQLAPVKGWRILSKTTLAEADIAHLLKDRDSLGEIIHTNPRTYFEILGEDKARVFKEEIEKIKLNA